MRPARIINVEQQTPNAATCSTVASSSRSKRHLEERILNCLAYLAKLLEKDEVYLPIFLRFEAELERVRRDQDALKRARTYLRKSD